MNDVNARHDGGEICRAVSSIAARQHQHAPHVEDCELRSQRVVLDGRTRPIALPPPLKRTVIKSREWCCHGGQLKLQEVAQPLTYVTIRYDMLF